MLRIWILFQWDFWKAKSTNHWDWQLFPPQTRGQFKPNHPNEAAWLTTGSRKKLLHGEHVFCAKWESPIDVYMFFFGFGRSLLPNKDDKRCPWLSSPNGLVIVTFWVWWWKPRFSLYGILPWRGIFWYVLFDVLTKTWTSRIIITAKCCRAGFSPVLDCNNRRVGWRLYGLRMDVQRFSVGPGRISGDKVRREQILNTLPWVYFQLVMLWYLIVILALCWQGFS